MEIMCAPFVDNDSATEELTRLMEGHRLWIGTRRFHCTLVFRPPGTLLLMELALDRAGEACEQLQIVDPSLARQMLAFYIAVSASGKELKLLQEFAQALHTLLGDFISEEGTSQLSFLNAQAGRL